MNYNLIMCTLRNCMRYVRTSMNATNMNSKSENLMHVIEMLSCCFTCATGHSKANAKISMQSDWEKKESATGQSGLLP